VVKDDLLKIDKLDHPVGVQVSFDHVMLVGTPMYTMLGRPFVGASKVFATVEEQTLSSKLIVFKYKRRKGYKRAQGHRKLFTILRVDRIEHSIEGIDAVLLQRF
jgi:large subunit ribosomal protein L21